MNVNSPLLLSISTTANTFHLFNLHNIVEDQKPVLREKGKQYNFCQLSNRTLWVQSFCKDSRRDQVTFMLTVYETYH